MSKLNARLSAFRPAFLGATLLLAFMAMTSSARAAGCTAGSTRVIVTNIACCQTGVRVTKQNQTCSGGVWVNNGNSYCAPNSICAAP
jgi:P pilus assembly chaperone PapD